MTLASERSQPSALVAKGGVLALVVLPIIASDVPRQFLTPANDLGFVLFENWWKLAEAAGIGGAGWAKFNTIEVLIAITAGAICWSNLLLGRRELVLTFEHVLSVLFLAAVAMMFALGIGAGGNLEPALWQVRPYFQLVAIALLIPQVVRTPADLKVLLGVMLAAIVARALLALAIFVFLANGRFSGWRALVGHEDSVFFVAAICFLFAYVAYAHGAIVRVWSLLLGSVLLAALALNLRRAGYVALAMNMGLLTVIMTGRRRLTIGLLVACGLVAAIYLVAFWNADGALAQLAQKVRSVFGDGDASDVTSNFYRTSENLNLWHTVRGHPMGTGFGVPFDKVYAMADISSILPNWEYHPHNAIFGLWMQLGSVGFALFLFFYSGVLVSASYAIRQASDAFGRSAAVFCVTALTSGLLVSNLDQFISTQRGGLFLGAVVGVVATISAMQGRTIALARHEHITEFATSK
jgi:hypothetical protein